MNKEHQVASLNYDAKEVVVYKVRHFRIFTKKYCNKGLYFGWGTFYLTDYGKRLGSDSEIL